MIVEWQQFYDGWMTAVLWWLNDSSLMMVEWQLFSDGSAVLWWLNDSSLIMVEWQRWLLNWWGVTVVTSLRASSVVLKLRFFTNSVASGSRLSSSSSSLEESSSPDFCFWKKEQPFTPKVRQIHKQWRSTIVHEKELLAINNLEQSYKGNH